VLQDVPRLSGPLVAGSADREQLVRSKREIVMQFLEPLHTVAPGRMNPGSTAARGDAADW
jgi:hypothetical protein